MTLKRKLILFFLLVVFVLPFKAINILAQEDFENGQESIEETVLNDEAVLDVNSITSSDTDNVIEGNFFAAEQNLIIDKNVNGDVMVVANNLRITGDVSGDIIAAAENLEITGKVGGDVRVAGKNIIINSEINNNLNVFGMSIEIGENAVIGKDVLVYGQIFKENGTVQGNLIGGAYSAELLNSVGGNVEFDLGSAGQLALGDSSFIGGELKYSSKEAALIDENARIEGEIIHNDAVDEASSAKGINLFGMLIALFGMIAVGMVMFALDKKVMFRVVDEMLEKPNKSMLWGVLYFVAAPIAAFILPFTIIGIPIALILIALYAVALYVSQVFAGIAIGALLLRRGKSVSGKYNMNLLIVGLFVFVVLAALPFIGFIFRIITIFWGMGAIVNVLKRNKLEGEEGIEAK